MNSKIEKLGLRLNKTLDGIDQQASKWVARSLDKHLSIGITGFSGSGKSTFITSLIHQLKYSSNANLGGFLPARDDDWLTTSGRGTIQRLGNMIDVLTVFCL